jgi:hypothetical protein
LTPQGRRPATRRPEDLAPVLLLPAGMTARAAALLLVAAVGCTSTTYAQRGSPAAQDWLARHDSSDVEAELATDHPTGRAELTIDARSVTDIRFVAAHATVVPLEQVQRVVDVRHGVGVLDGSVLGLSAGVLFGLIYGATRPLSAYEQSMDCTIVCNHGDAAKLGALMFGALGLVVGAATGAVVGARDELDLR